MSDNLVDVRTLVSSIEDHTVIKMSPTFPFYEPGDDLDVLVMDRERALRAVWDYHAGLLADVAELRVTDVETHCHADFFVGEILDFRIDLIDSLDFFSRFEVRPSFVTKVLRDRRAWTSDDRVFVPAPEDDLTFRYFEYLEYFEQRPDKIKHLDYICDVADEDLRRAFLENTHRYVRFRRKKWLGELAASTESVDEAPDLAADDAATNGIDLASEWARLPEALGLPSDATIVDVGAHALEEAQAIVPVLQGCRWFAFEPDPRSAERIRETVSSRPMLERVVFTEAAVGSTAGRATLYMSSGRPPDAPPDAEDWTASSSTKAPTGILERWPWTRFDKSIDVPMVSLDGFCRRKSITGIDMLKIDARGAEFDVVLGARDMLARTHYIVMEHTCVGLYEGARSLKDTMLLLPDVWHVRERYLYDVVLENTAFLGSVDSESAETAETDEPTTDS